MSRLHSWEKLEFKGSVSYIKDVLLGTTIDLEGETITIVGWTCKTCGIVLFQSDEPSTILDQDCDTNCDRRLMTEALK